MPGAAESELGFVGRVEELAQVRGVVQAAALGRCAALLVTGEAGSGKTSLVQQGCAQGDGEVEVLWGSCLPLLSASIPFLPLTTAVRDWAKSQDRSPESGRVPSWPGEARTLGDVLTAFDEWLSRVAEQRATLLVIDDLQWADRSSLDALMYVLTGPQNRHLAVVTTIREGEATHGGDLRRWLADVRRLPRVAELRLAPLDRVTTGHLIADRFGRPPHDSLIDEVFTRSGGNPYLATLLISGVTPDAECLPPGLPDELRDAVSRSWHGLSEAARELTQLVAVSGRPQPADLLREVAARQAPHLDVLPALREAVRRRVLVATGDTGQYWVAHPLMAEVLAADVLPEDARAWHASYARVLTRSMSTVGADDAESVVAAADHYMAAGDRGEALRWTLQGAEAAEAAGGAAEALRLSHRALHLQAVVDSSLNRVDLLHRIRALARRTGALSEELEAIDGLLELLDPTAVPLQVSELLVRRARLRQYNGRQFAGAGDITRAVELAREDPDSRQYAMALAELARIETWRGTATAAARASEAVTCARASGDSAALSYALTGKIMAWCMGADGDAYDGDREQDGRQALGAGANSGDYDVYVHAVVWVANARDGIMSRDWIAVAQEAREELTARAAPHPYIAVLAAFEAEGLLLLGDWRGCEQRLRIATGFAPGPFSDASARLVAARLAGWQGRWAEATGHLTRAQELLTNPSAFLGLPFDSTRAELAIAAGDTESAFTISVTALPHQPDLYQRLLPTAARAAADQAQACRDRGETPQQPLQRLDQLLRDYPAPLLEANAGPGERAHAHAMHRLHVAEQARGRDQPAFSAWIDAADACAAAGLAWDEAYARWRAAYSGFQQRRRSGSALTQLRRANVLATDLHAAPLLTHIHALAAGSGTPLPAVEPTTATTTDDHCELAFPGLTPRETQILHHVGAGHTYRQIADTLVISEKTVSVHVSNLLRKTNTTNRIELAQKYRRLATTRPGNS
jgi:DNA-binding CsgD family transcriptional regulator/tetratricopeptide (TPR) repeat protein